MKRMKFLKESLLNLVGMLTVSFITLAFLSQVATGIDGTTLSLGLLAAAAAVIALLHHKFKIVAARLRDMFPHTDKVFLYGTYFVAFVLTSGLVEFMLYISPSKQVKRFTVDDV